MNDREPGTLAYGPAGAARPAEPRPEVAIVIVGFRNADDIVGCLRALGRARTDPPFRVLIAENGGPDGMDGLMEALDGANSPCRPMPIEPPGILPFPVLRHRAFQLAREDGSPGQRVHVAEMTENLGYGGAINAWLRPLLAISGWRGVWVLNPDTEPTPDALAELVAHAARRGKGMVGSRITTLDEPDRVRTRGLAWRRLTARTMAVGFQTPADIEPDAAELEALLDAPSGASFYVTRAMIERIGLMDERYFLFFEDLEWGCRAKDAGGLGYAHRSIVPHKGGTTIGGAGGRASVSPLSVYLEIRNRIIFVRQRHPAWLAWTALAQTAYAAAFILAGSPANARAAYRGLVAGLRGEAGRPDLILGAHRS